MWSCRWDWQFNEWRQCGARKTVVDIEVEWIFAAATRYILDRYGSSKITCSWEVLNLSRPNQVQTPRIISNSIRILILQDVRGVWSHMNCVILMYVTCIVLSGGISYVRWFFVWPCPNFDRQGQMDAVEEWWIERIDSMRFIFEWAWRRCGPTTTRRQQDNVSVSYCLTVWTRTSARRTCFVSDRLRHCDILDIQCCWLFTTD